MLDAAGDLRSLANLLAPFDLTHHLAMALLCGVSDGLPVSVMLIGQHWVKATI